MWCIFFTALIIYDNIPGQSPPKSTCYAISSSNVASLPEALNEIYKAGLIPDWVNAKCIKCEDFPIPAYPE